MKNNMSAYPERSINGLITFDEAGLLSKKIYPLGDQWNEICEDLYSAGYGMPTKEYRTSCEKLAETDMALLQLHAYWRDYAKERLAALVGPMNIFKGIYAPFMAFRSQLIESLREDAKNGKLKSTSRIVSPQIEPTVKRRIEMMPDCAEALGVHEKSKQAQQKAILNLQVTNKPDFLKLTAREKYNLLIARYCDTLIPFGFKLDPNKKSGAVFRKITSDGKWAFLLVDDSRDGMDMGGGLYPTFALTLPRKAVLPEYPSLNSVATFRPGDLVPEFHVSCGFAKDSCQEFFLAIDTVASLTTIIFTRLDKLLTESVDTLT